MSLRVDDTHRSVSGVGTNSTVFIMQCVPFLQAIHIHGGYYVGLGMFMRVVQQEGRVSAMQPKQETVQFGIDGFVKEYNLYIVVNKLQLSRSYSNSNINI